MLMDKGNANKAMKTLLIIIIVLLIAAILFMVCISMLFTWEFAFDSSAERVGQTVQWRGRTYIYTYGEYDTKRKIDVTRDYKWRLTSIDGDPEHNFIELSSFLDNYLYVDKDYEIPTSGEITAVYVDNDKVDNEIFCNTIDSIINGTGDAFEFYSDGLYQDVRRIYLCYENCPVGTGLVGYIGYINDEWVYISLTQNINNNSENGWERGAVQCIIIDEEYIPVLLTYEYGYPNYYDE